MIRIAISIILSLLAASGCKQGADSGTLPEMGRVEFSKPLQKSATDFAGEVSGLCLSKDGDFLWGVGDNGDIFKIQFDGTYEHYASFDADLEGFTLDPATGNLYLAVEPGSAYTMTAPAYGTPTLLFTVADAAGLGNDGTEGITWHKGNLYLGAQTEAYLWEYTPDGKRLSGKSLRTIAPTLSEIAGLCYDPENDYLWVIDSQAKSRKVPDMLPFTLYLFDGDATKLLATYDLSAFANINPESVCIDRKNGCIWVAEDDGSKRPSILHKILFTNL